MDYSKYLPLQRNLKNHQPLYKINIYHQPLTAELVGQIFVNNATAN